MIAALRFPSLFLDLEQMENPGLSGRPVAITATGRQAWLLAASPEAQARGVMPGQALAEAMTRCPELGRLNARLAHYKAASRQVLTCLEDISPLREATALDECYLDLTSCQRYYGHQPTRVASLIHDTLNTSWPGLHVRIGISGDKSTARVAANLAADRAFHIIHPEAARDTLSALPLHALCDIGHFMAPFLGEHGLATCGDLQRFPASQMAQHFGTQGRRLWLMASGQDPEPVQAEPDRSQSINAGKLLPPGSRDAAILLFQWHKLCEKLLTGMAPATAYTLQTGFRCDTGWRQSHCLLPAAREPALLYRLVRQHFQQHWFGEAVMQLRLMARPAPATVAQHDIFQAPTGRQGRGKRQATTNGPAAATPTPQTVT